MNKTEKTALISKIKGEFDKAVSIALVDYQGLTVANVTKLRREFKKAGVKYSVFKNTLIRHALKDSPYKSLVGDVSADRKNSPKPHGAVRGMTGVAWSESDPSAPAKVIQAFRNELPEKERATKLQMKIGLVGGSLIDEAALAKMPNLQETRGMILGLLQAPAANLYLSLIGPGAMIAGILEAGVAKQEAAAKAG